MKAAVIHHNGGLDEVKVEDLAAPTPNDDEVVIEIRAASLNHLDIWVRKGRPGVELSMPHILGSDAAGVVIDSGSRVTLPKLGDPVIVNPGLYCGKCEFCLRGQQSECMTFGIVGMNCPGTFAEYVAIPAVNVLPKPEYLTWEEAAAFPLAYVTAWRMLMTRAQLESGESVLIHGIGGGVALAALQLAKLAGARVIVTSSSNDKLLQAKEYGADHAINYETESDIAAAVRNFTGGIGADVIIDTTGAATWPVNFDAARRGGRIVHCGVTTGAEAPVNISALYWNQISVLGSTLGSHEDFRQLVAAIAVSRLHPIIDSVEPIERIRAAMGRMERGQQFGKIVITPHIATGTESERAKAHPGEAEHAKPVQEAMAGTAETEGKG